VSGWRSLAAVPAAVAARGNLLLTVARRPACCRDLHGDKDPQDGIQVTYSNEELLKACETAIKISIAPGGRGRQLQWITARNL
jgi:hypothetical protein